MIMKRSFFLLLVLAFAFSCVKNDVKYKPKTYSGLTIPDSFDWAMVKSVALTVIPADTYDGRYDYKIDVYVTNPLSDSTAKAISGGVANVNKSLTLDVSYPVAAEYLYVMQTSPTGNRAVIPVNIDGSDLTCDFSKMLAGPELRAVSADYPEFPAQPQITDDPALGSDSLALSGNLSSGDAFWNEHQMWNPGSYYIPEGETLNFTGSFPSGTKIHVFGTLFFNGPRELFWENGYVKIYGAGIFKSNITWVINGGSVINYGTIESDNIQTNSNCFFYNAGTVNVNNTFLASNSDPLINLKDFYAGSLSMSTAGIFYNGASLNVGNKITLSNSKTLVNSGEINAGYLDAVSNATIYNNCNMNFSNDLEEEGTNMFLYEGSYLYAKKASRLNNTNTYMQKGAIFKIENTSNFVYNNNVYGEDDTEYSLLSLDKVSIGWGGLICRGNLFVEYNVSYRFDLIPLGGAVIMGRPGESGFTIEESECNNGGVADSSTTDPNNPEYPIINEGLSGTVIMEDLWPYMGDFDMNDIVVDLKPSYAVNSDNKVEYMKIAYTLKAMGSTMDLGFGLQFDEIPASGVSSVEYFDDTPVSGNAVFQTSGGVESGQTYAVVPLFQEGHLWLRNKRDITMTNTITSAEYFEPKSDTVKITFSSPVDLSLLQNANLNYFTVVSYDDTPLRREIHLRGFNVTDKGVIKFFGKYDDGSDDNVTFVSKSNYPWGFFIPSDSFQYTTEYANILEAYPNFKEWCSTNNADYVDWYNQVKVDSLIFKRE